MKNKADILRDWDTNEIVVLDERGREIFRKPYNKQTLSIAHTLYMYSEYHEEYEKYRKY